jgi:hypothetical protein
VFPDNLEVTVAGALPPREILYSEVSLKQSENFCVGEETGADSD